jgi:diacylglycerol kinase family enzyme
MLPAFVNPGAANAAGARRVLEEIGGFCIREAPPATLAEQVRRTVDEGTKRVVVAGGDGSISIAASVLAGSGVELAILPSGTLNHFARGIGLPLEMHEAAQLALSAGTRPIDVGAVNDRIFLNTSAVGAYVSFVRMRERVERQFGYGFASLVAGVRLLLHMPNFSISLRVEGVSREYVTPLVFIGVGERELRLPTLGARVPGGKTGLHVMVVRERSGGRALAMSLAAATKGVAAVSQTPAMDSFLVDTCTVLPRVPRIALDGEIVSATPPLRYRHIPAHLHVVACA